MGIFASWKAGLREKAAQRNLERMAYKEEYNKARIKGQKRKAKIEAAESLGLTRKSKKAMRKTKVPSLADNFNTDFGKAEPVFKYEGFK